MNIFDGFSFWLGKMLAELAVTVGVVVLVIIGALVFVVLDERAKRKRRASK